MPRAKDAELESAFHTWKDDDRRGLTVRCNHCGWTRAKHAGRQRKHLEECPALSGTHTLPHPPSPSHPTPPQKHRILSLLSTRALIMTAHPFNLYEDDWMREYLRTLGHDGEYMPPTRHQAITEFSGELFRQEYRGIKNKLEVCGWIDVVLERIEGDKVGVWTVAGGVVYFWTVLEGRVEELVEGVFRNVEAMLSHRTMGVCWRRWNAVVVGDLGDELVAAVLQCVKVDARTRHVWFVPCVGRGLGGLVRDLLEVEGYKGTWDNAGLVARAVRERAGGAQWELLRECQWKCYGESRCILLPYIEQWGTHWELPRCLWRNREALQTWVMHPRHEVPHDVERLIRNPAFWMHIEAVTKLISGIFDRQKTAEVGPHFNIGKVDTLWAEMRHHVEATASPEALPIVLDMFDKKMAKQHSTLFTIAHALDPRNAIAYRPSPEATRILIDFVCQYSENPAEARSQFTQFCTGTGVFTRTNRAYDLVNDPIAFWTEMMLFSKPLAELALRVFNTPSTSAPCQRDYMTGRPVHVGWRLNFGLQKANELYFVYVNRRLLTPGYKSSALLYDEKTLVDKEDRDFGVISHDEHVGSEDNGEEKTSGEAHSDSLEPETPTTVTPDIRQPMEVPTADAIAAVKSAPTLTSPGDGYEDREMDAQEVKRAGMDEKFETGAEESPRGIDIREIDRDGGIDSDELDAPAVEDELDTMGPESLTVGDIDSDGIVVAGLGAGGLDPAGTGIAGTVDDGGGAGGMGEGGVGASGEDGRAGEMGENEDGQKDEDAVGDDLVHDSLDSKAYAQVGLG